MFCLPFRYSIMPSFPPKITGPMPSVPESTITIEIFKLAAKIIILTCHIVVFISFCMLLSIDSLIVIDLRIIVYAEQNYILSDDVTTPTRGFMVFRLSKRLCLGIIMQIRQ